MHTKLKNKIIIPCCFILLQIYLLPGITPLNLAAESFSIPGSIAPEDWTYMRLENLLQGTIVSRDSWAKLPPDNGSTIGFYNSERKPVQFIGIHHDGSSDSTLTSVLKYHIKTNGWGDIAYHYIIDKKGRIYEGRSIDRASDTNYIFDSYGEERLSSIINILLLGNYNVETIKADSPQIQSAKLLVSYLYLKYPLVTLDSIRGHKDFIPDTENVNNLVTCPGKNMYSPVNMIDEIKNFVHAVSISNNGKTY